MQAIWAWIDKLPASTLLAIGIGVIGLLFVLDMLSDAWERRASR